MPAELDHYCWKKLNDAQINHSLDILHGGVMQNVAMAPALLNFPVVEKPAFLIFLIFGAVLIINSTNNNYDVIQITISFRTRNLFQ